MIFNAIINIFAAVMELAACMEVAVGANRRDKFNTPLIIIASVVYILLSLISAVIPIVPAFLIFINAVILFVLLFSFDIKTAKRIFIVILLEAISVSIDLFVRSIAASSYKTSPEAIIENRMVFVLTVLISKLLLYFMMTFVAHILKDRGNVSIKYTVLHLTVPIVSCLVLFTQSYFAARTDNREFQIVSIILSFAIVVVNIASLIIFSILERKENEIMLNAFKVKELEKEREYYEKNIEANMRSNKVMHDLKHILFALNNRIQTDDNVNELINEMCGIINDAQIVKYTNVQGLNILLNAKWKEMRDKEIKPEYKIILGNCINVDDIDLCVLAGNILDNAIEAAVKTDNKSVAFEMTDKGKYIILRAVNSTINTSVGVGTSTKEDGMPHGMGLASVSNIVDKYDGSMDFNVKDGYFNIYLMLKNIKI